MGVRRRVPPEPAAGPLFPLAAITSAPASNAASPAIEIEAQIVAAALHLGDDYPVEHGYGDLEGSQHRGLVEEAAACSAENVEG